MFAEFLQQAKPSGAAAEMDYVSAVVRHVLANVGAKFHLGFCYLIGRLRPFNVKEYEVQMRNDSVDFIVRYCGDNDPAYLPIIRARGQELYRGHRFTGPDAMIKAMAKARDVWDNYGTRAIIEFRKSNEEN